MAALDLPGWRLGACKRKPYALLYVWLWVSLSAHAHLWLLQGGPTNAQGFLTVTNCIFEDNQVVVRVMGRRRREGGGAAARAEQAGAHAGDGARRKRGASARSHYIQIA